MIDIPVSFDSQGNIEFYGVGVNRNDYTASNADYTDTNVYWLVPSLTSTPVMSTKASVSSGTAIPSMITHHEEQDTIYWPQISNGTGVDHWFWEKFNSNTSLSHNFTINDYDNLYSTTPITLSYSVISQTSVNPHSLRYLLLNPNLNNTDSWTDSLPHTFMTTFTGNIVNGAPSSFQFTDSSALDVFYFNWLELEYPGKALNDQIIFHGNNPGSAIYSFSINGFSQSTIELFDISDPQSPLKITNPAMASVSGGFQLTYSDTLTASIPNNYIALAPVQRRTPSEIVELTTTDLHSLAPGFDYLIITHSSFLSNVQTLANYRNSAPGGSHVPRIVTVESVYDSFSGGIFSPRAIQDFLGYLYQNSIIVNPGYVLLVGDASFDYRNIGGFGLENLVPTYLMETSFEQTPSDYWFVPHTGAGAPLLVIGRLPAKSITETDTMISKIINYETNVPSSNWNKNVTFISGEDSVGNFDSESNSLLTGSAFPSTITNIMQIYHSNFTTTASFTASIIGSINSGALITNYMGHGSVGVWANANSGNLSNTYLQSTDPYTFANSSQLTFLVTLECLNGMFAGTDEGKSHPVSMAEAFLKSNGGAVAVFSPTGQGLTNFHSPLAEYLYNTIFATGYASSFLPEPILGKAIQTAEKNILLSASYSGSQQMLETVGIFVLLGDPATQLALP